MKKQNFLCVDLKTLTQETGLQPGEGRKGMLTMTEESEKFMFVEGIGRKRQPTNRVIAGKRLNINLTPDGRLMVYMRKVELTRYFNPHTFANEIFTELANAKADLGLV